jgi:hypothetical protein
MSPAKWRDLLFAEPPSIGSPAPTPSHPASRSPQATHRQIPSSSPPRSNGFGTGSLLRLNEYIVLSTSVEKWGSDKRAFQALRDCFSIVRDPGTIPRGAADRLQQDHFRVQPTVPPSSSDFLSGLCRWQRREGSRLALSEHLSPAI